MSDEFKKILHHGSTEPPKKRQSPCLAEFKKFKVVWDYGEKTNKTNLIMLNVGIVENLVENVRPKVVH